MKNDPKIDLGMTGYAELFLTEEQRKEQKLPRILDVPMRFIDEFPNHPFQVRMRSTDNKRRHGAYHKLPCLHIFYCSSRYRISCSFFHCWIMKSLDRMSASLNT